MPSTVSWLDYDDRDRQLVMNAVESLAERNAVDELGLSTIRNALADAFFPGTSTLHTRLRYFLFVSWIFRENEGRPGQAKRTRKQEEVLIGALKLHETQGVVGIMSGSSVKRMPSVIYWNGLRQWGLYRSSRDLDTILANGASSRSINVERDDDGNPSGGFRRPGWDPSLPKAPDGYLEDTSFELTADEGQYLAEKILHNCKGTLLDHAVRKLQMAPLQLEGEVAEFPWESPLIREGLPPALGRLLDHAQAFSLATHGAWLLYNLMLAEAVAERTGSADSRAEHIPTYAELLSQWQGEASRSPVLANWDLEEFFRAISALGELRPKVRDFVAAWVTRQPWTLPRLATDEGVRRLIRDREKAVKGGRARLDNASALQRWQGSSGIGRLDYRWRIARSHLVDLGAALAKGAE